MRPTTLADRLRRPEYTGENRCTPCTVVNAGLAVAVAGLVAASGAPLAGAASLVIAGAAIYLRGYLIPGTPALTARYFPPWFLRLFGKEPVVDATAGSRPGGGNSGEDRPLAESDVLVSGPDGPALAPSFAGAWHDRTAEVRDAGVEPAAVARTFGAETASSVSDRSFVLDGTRSVRWGSETALAADVAAAALLADRVPAWSSFDHERRRSVLQGLRLTLDRCPACGATLTVETDRVDPCCQRAHLVAESVCDTCDTAIGDAAVVDTDDTDSVRGALLDA